MRYQPSSIPIRVSDVKQNRALGLDEGALNTTGEQPSRLAVQTLVPSSEASCSSKVNETDYDHFLERVGQTWKICGRCQAKFSSNKALHQHKKSCLSSTPKLETKDGRGSGIRGRIEASVADKGDTSVFRQSGNIESGEKSYSPDPETPHVSLTEQLRIINAVRALEEKLLRARSDLHKAMKRAPSSGQAQSPASDHSTAWSATASNADMSPIVLTKDDYLNLVDLYFYSHQSRFAPDSPDSSPTPLFLDDYSFRLSSDFSEADPSKTSEEFGEEEEEDVSPLKHVEAMLKSRQLREISAMQAFVDLLLNDSSSNKSLFETYKKLPEPGVAHLPTGVVRLFLQRMSTPSVKSERSMLRYLSLIDDMQKAGLRITESEWTSAIYLAGRSFSRVVDSDIAHSFRIWGEMEQEAGVRATNVTFNILFDIAVKAGKFVLGEAVLREMHSRGLRLNRLGRVSLMYYHGLRGDGDGVRKAYRDFVEAGEIVDTLVLNCVMASLIHAQEPAAAEQVYERMKRLQDRLRTGSRVDEEDALFLKYPPPGSNRLGSEMASNSLGRILLKSANLQSILPEHHAKLQKMMPLTPDKITFRNLISHHASKSGDLDRLTVLISDMSDLFRLPFTTLSFQLLFKGFSVHGGSGLEEAKWTKERLDLVWEACLAAIGQRGTKSRSGAQDDSIVNLPSMADVEAIPLEEKGPTTSSFQPRRSAWKAFLKDISSEPDQPGGTLGAKSADEFASPFFPNDSGDRPGFNLESDPEDSYHLPAADVRLGSSSSAQKGTSEVRPTKWLVIWLIRAYAKCTSSRVRLEEIWRSIRTVWKPGDVQERDAVVRVLRRALKHCDTKGPL